MDKKEAHRIRNKKYRDAHREELRVYHREYARKWRLENPEKWEKNWRSHYRKSLAEKTFKLETLAGRPKSATCEVCGSTKKISYDHDHATGKFRGWLCGACNSALGMVQDRTEVLYKLIAYLHTSKGMSTPSFNSNEVIKSNG